MSSWTVFLNLGKRIWTVTRQKGELDLDTGISPVTYQFKRELALVGSKKYGFSSHLKLDESQIALAKKVELVVIDREAYDATYVGSLGELFVYKIDKVSGNEYHSIVAAIPT